MGDIGLAEYWDRVTHLEEQIHNCQDCALHKNARHPIPSNGNWNTTIMLVGEAPGRIENEQGQPFIGPSGQYLRSVLGAISEQLFITNVCKCYPPACRTPDRIEILRCSKWLYAQIRELQPQLIIGAGSIALNALLLSGQASITKLHGQELTSKPIFGTAYKLFALYHPAAVLRRPKLKRSFENDVHRLLDAQI